MHPCYDLVFYLLDATLWCSSSLGNNLTIWALPNCIITPALLLVLDVTPIKGGRWHWTSIINHKAAPPLNIWMTDIRDGHAYWPLEPHRERVCHMGIPSLVLPWHSQESRLYLSLDLLTHSYYTIGVRQETETRQLHLIRQDRPRSFSAATSRPQ